MKKKILALGIGSIVALALVGCSSEVSNEAEKTDVDKEKDTKTNDTTKVDDTAKVDENQKEVSVEEAIKLAIEDNAKDMQDENIEGYMDDLILPEEQVEPTKEMLTQIFDNFDIIYEISDVQILEQTDSTVKVQATQVSKEKNHTEGYQDNKSVLTHTLKLVDGTWKFEKSEIKSVEYLGQE